ncbi:nitronate monooxygenase [Bradyrhizobium sp. U87765 SZCCT0131]|uniref:NAD(P)H-dependent flavin oxidoreductase n=1 Tax=unclassified Bradyrhizobium TaxID=2631580 RepID=UPI001BAA3B06|nr:MULTISPECIES: nitronate monooxygenase [unclassified Bradyrhizobium]MBR1218014.1 nitronate monooxygenase [Bradyrhizobium sp. U87765 SZCCT0131]MBR1261040.1 nitronate monooxygenase [Bradyrhizobium sp. U87765 SZCCT0134]MBR1303512.1 nitronate monooxygenase [Bradyrhizobium sp. U87765 SZCCT0110]MBR1319118.1 nitronate monooxygenase [Bradyrhizobium sp. U87765 SZCCT0109]MBR1347443.1 nitronate monooxygenase [Bradyrhizobium sp. U87765 SZCCT0048]
MPGSLQTILCDRLGSRYPIVQTAMGWVADANLTAATCNAGGFGFFAGATTESGDVENQLQAIKSKTDRPFGVNFHMFQPNAEEVIAAVIRHKVRAVSYGRGPDAKTIRRLKDAGVVCMPTVGALKHAVKAVELGADIITVQGGEGGGHTGAVPTTILLPQVLDAVKVPVVAAGGFFDGRGLAAALSYGAAGIAMGTRFLMTRDSPVPLSALERYLKTNDPTDIRVTTAVDGLPQRFIENAEIRRLENMGLPARLAMSMKYARQWGRESGLGPIAMVKLGLKVMSSGDNSFAQTVMAPNLPTLVQRGVVAGDADAGLLPSGQAAAMISKLESCEDLISRIVQEATVRLRSASALVAAA